MKRLLIVVALLVSVPASAQQPTDRDLLHHLKALIDAHLAPAPEPNPGPQVIVVPAEGNAQDAINNAPDGAIVALTAGATYQGPLVLNRPVTLTTDGWADKGIGHDGRVTPADAANMARIVANATAGAGIDIPPGATDVNVFGVLVDACGPDGTCDLIRIGSGSLSDPALMPQRVVVRQCLLLGSPQFGGWRGISANGEDILIEQSWVQDIFKSDRDSQAVAAWRGGRNVTLRFNYLQAGSENILTGGATIPSEAFIPANWTVEENIVHKPDRWRSTAQGGDGRDRDVKNLLEFKHIRGAVVRRNYFKGNWAAAQDGKAILFHYVTQGNCPSCGGVTDIDFSDNVVVRSPAGLSVQGFSYWADSHNAGRVERLTIRNNYVWLDGTGRLLWMANVHGRHDITVERNTFRNTGTTWLTGSFGYAWIDVEGVPTRVPGTGMLGLRIIDNVITNNGTYGVTAPDSNHYVLGMPTFAPDAVISGNIIGDSTGVQISRLNAFQGEGLANELAVKADMLAALPWTSCGTWTEGRGADCTVLSEVFALSQYLPEP